MTCALSYFFFSYADRDKQDVFNMLSSIAGQLCRQVKNIPASVITHYKKNMSRPPSSIMLEIISCLSQCFHRVYIVVDALDEIEVNQRDLLIPAIKDLVKMSRLFNINVLMTSRREQYLVDGFTGISLQQMSLTTSIVDEDIKLYVSKIISTELPFCNWSDELKTNMCDTLTKEANGM